MMPDDKINNKYKFSQNWNITFARNWIDHLQEWTDNRKNKPLSYLEIGIYEGRSGCWMLDNILTHPQSSYVGIDAWVDKRTKDVAHKNLSHHQDKIRIIEGDSRFELRKLIPNSFDVVYIDACHIRENAFFDSVLVWDLSKDLIIWDDYRNPNFTHYGVEDAVDSMLGNIPPTSFEVLFKNRQICLRKSRWTYMLNQYFPGTTTFLGYTKMI